MFLIKAPKGFGYSQYPQFVISANNAYLLHTDDDK